MASSDISIRICDVAPRDGLQNLSRLFSVDEKIALVEQLISAGVRHIEVGSFVNPARVPQMAGIEEVLQRVQRPDDVRFAVLALNSRGEDRALACAIDEMRYVIVASETFSQRNQGASIAEAEAGFAEAVKKTHAQGRIATAVIAASFGCPYEGDIDPRVVARIAERAVNVGADEVVFADTIGAGVPAQVTALCASFHKISATIPFGFHFHNTRNTGYANAIAAVNGGSTIIDASVGGIGGCPFAPNATGNIATEDLHYMLRQSGIKTGLQTAALQSIVDWLAERIPDEITGQLAQAGSFPEIATATSQSRKDVTA